MRQIFFISIYELLFLTGCINLADDCQTEIGRRIFNPAHSAQAITLITGCGATTSPSYGVRLIEGADTTDIGTRENTILGSETSVKINWISNDTLSITNADTSFGSTMKNEFTLPKSKKLIRIIYSKSGPTDSTVIKQTFKLTILKGPKDSVYSEADTFSKNYPDIKTSINYSQPYFILTAGECNESKKAKKLKELLKTKYPNASIEICK